MLVLAVSSVGVAEQRGDPAAVARTIAPFVNERTVVVVRVDVAGFDLEAIWKRLAAEVGAEVEGEAGDLAKGRQEVTQWREQFIQAGGKEFYILMSFSTEIDPGYCMVVPLVEGADTDVLGNLLRYGSAEGPEVVGSVQAETIKGTLVIGMKEQLDQLQQKTMAKRPELVKALETIGQAEIQVVIIPNDELRGFLGASLLGLPKDMGGGEEAAVLADGFMWQSIGLTGPPEMSLKAVTQVRNEESAQQIADLHAKMLKGVEAELAESYNQEYRQGWLKLLQTLMPSPNNEQLVLELDNEQTNNLMFEMFIPQVVRARGMAKRAISASHLRQLYLGCALYATNYEGEFPANLEVLVEEGYMPDREVLVNPRWPEKKEGYVYLRPSKRIDQIEHPYLRIVMYEAYEEWPEGVNACFLDGRVEFIEDQERFEELLAESREALGTAEPDSDQQLPGGSDSPESDVRKGVAPEILTALDRLEKLGGTLKNLQADLTLEKIETIVSDKTIKEGKLYYQRKKDDIRFRLSFSKTHYVDETVKDPEDFVFADGWLKHRQELVKQEDHYQSLRPGQSSSDLMHIGSSPLPIPIGQKTEEILRNFKVSLIEPDEKSDPAGAETVHLELVPKEGTELDLSYKRLEFWLAEPQGLPIRSRWENDSLDIFTADLKKTRINKGLSSRAFNLPAVSYKPVLHPLPEEQEDIPVD